MNVVTRFLEWLDEAAAGLIRLAYLLAGITAVAVYFGAGHLPPRAEDVFNAALPWSLAGAVELHTYLSARRVRTAWQDGQVASKGSIEHHAANRALKVNLAILGFLLAFSCWNQLNYLYETWIPPQTALALPGWTSYVVRALVVPCAFMAAAFLAPLAPPITAQIEAEARATLADVFKVARKQRRDLLKRAKRDGRDMSAALVELVNDPSVRDVIERAYGAINAAPPSRPLALPAPDSPSASQEGRGETLGRSPRTRKKTTAKGGKVIPMRTRNQRLSYEELRAAAFVLLDNNPTMTQNQLRDHLAVRQDRAGKILAEWREIQRAGYDAREEEEATS